MSSSADALVPAPRALDPGYWAGTGPPYPPPPAPGSQAIGVGRVGTTLQIGDIQAFDYRSTIISQYANSPVICLLVDAMNAWLDPTHNIESFFDNIFNVDTAVGYGLDVWGRIVGVNRVVQIAIGKWFGFAQGLPDTDVFGGGPQPAGSAFWTGQPLTSNYYFADQQYRRMILAKAAFNITDGSIKGINKIMMMLFPQRGNAWVSELPADMHAYFGFWQADGLGPPGASIGPAGESDIQGFGLAGFFSGQFPPSRMSITYHFAFQLSAAEIAMVTQSGILPRPGGVKSNVVVSY
jgi:hypothetical protein